MSEDSRQIQNSNRSPGSSVTGMFANAFVTFTHNGEEIQMPADKHAEFQHENHFGCPVAADGLVQQYRVYKQYRA